MKYFIIAGEASGDLQASNLMRELRKQDSKAEFCFLGGDLMLAQGGKLVIHYRQMAFMGIWGVLKNASKVLNNMRVCKKALIDFQPDVLILVDYPGFNLRIARFAKENFKMPVYYYISPKIWAWKEYRIKQIKKYIDKMFCIFPFETTFYAQHNYPVEYVGNPLVDSVCLRPNQDQNFNEFCSQNKLPHKPIIALLAGSRKQEISTCLPLMILATDRFPDYQAIIAGAPGIDADFYKTILKGKTIPVVFGKTYDVLQHSRAAIVNSGTATLETALVGTPQVVVYHLFIAKLTYMVMEFILKVKFISLVNLVANKKVVKELIGHYFTVDNVANELDKLMHDVGYRQQMLNDYSEIKKAFGDSGASERAAISIIRALESAKN